MNAGRISLLVYSKLLVLVEKLLSFSIKDFINSDDCCFGKEIEQILRMKREKD